MQRLALIVALLAGACGIGSKKEARVVRLATTTSVVDSGLLPKLIPLYEKRQGVKVEIASVGSGEALARLARGEADVAITHAPEEELALAQAGKARRTVVWRNDFVIVGPAGGTAVVAGAGDAVEAMRRIARSEKPWVSRGDDSGTHRREKALLARAGVTPKKLVEAKAGMGATLAKAAELDGFTLSDRATYLAKRKSLDLVILYQEDDALVNEYSVMEHDDTSLSTFLQSDEARAVVGAHGVKEHAEALFRPVPRP